ncbi:MAG TPA: ribosome-associated translation inhibitor RaiA [Stellaceae bacterium]|nr:ribosome-associated translation inhibitor RaiA [Stellaceae bacterium]
MQVTVTGKQFDVGESLRQHVITAMTAIVERYFEKATEGHVVFSRERHLVKAEISVHAGRGLSVQSGGTADDAHVAFDGAAERIDKRLRRHKRRLRNHHGRGREDGAAEAATAYVLAAQDDEADTGGTEGEPLVVAEMRTTIPVLSVSDAVMRLDLAELPALLFRNSARGNLNLVYRRPDGNFGWVDPDLAEARSRRGGKTA